MSSHDPVVLQPLLHHPYDGQHVCPVDIFFRNCVSFRERAVPCSLPVCRWVNVKPRLESALNINNRCYQHSYSLLQNKVVFFRRCDFHNGELHMQNNHGSLLPIFRSGTILLNIPKAKTCFTTNVFSVCVSPVRGCDGSARCRLHKGARGETRHHFPPNGYLFCRKCKWNSSCAWVNGCACAAVAQVDIVWCNVVVFHVFAAG